MNLLLSAVRYIIKSIRSEFYYQRKASKFNFSPTEDNLLESEWYRCSYWKKFLEGRTTLQYLDVLVRNIESDLSNPKLSERRRTILKNFQKGLFNARVREEIVLFLEELEFPGENSRPLWEMIHAAWRLTDNNVSPATRRIDKPAKEKTSRQELSPGEKPAADFHARTYIIAAHIHFELAGKEAEYETLSHYLPDLGRFISEHYKVQKLPGTFDKFKGYSYKKVLESRNASKKGQLKPFLRQIIQHPETFGAGISDHARQLLQQYFEE